jgi:hypothetical protein
LLQPHGAVTFGISKLKKITVLDPMLMNSPPSKSQDKHHNIVYVLHKALLACKDHFFSGWDVEDVGWVDVYTTDIDRRCKL